MEEEIEILKEYNQTCQDASQRSGKELSLTAEDQCLRAQTGHQSFAPSLRPSEAPQPSFNDWTPDVHDLSFIHLGGFQGAGQTAIESYHPRASTYIECEDCGSRNILSFPATLPNASAIDPELSACKEVADDHIFAGNGLAGGSFFGPN